MTSSQLETMSKFLSLVLRHQPGEIGIVLDKAGWVEISVLMEAMRRNGRAITTEQLKKVVATNSKSRFAFSEDGTKIRASQGHSVTVDLGLKPIEPPEFLYHGTATRFLSSIKSQGLKRMKRQHVHLSVDAATATEVGVRHGKVVVLTIKAREMHEKGLKFFKSDNGVWLTEGVSSGFIEFPEG